MEIKKFFLLLILHSTLYIVNCFSQQYGWVDISNNLPASNGTASLSDMHWISESEGWICSSALGEIYHTTDGGQTFETQTTQFYTNAIYMLNSQEGYTGGKEGRVYKTTNGGADWIPHGNIGGTLLDIDFPPNSDSGYCCGYNGKIYKITTSGISSMSSGLIAIISSISFPSTTQGWSSTLGLILHYDGNSWTQQDPPSEAYNDIFMINDSVGWAVGSIGVILKTVTGGQTINFHNWDYQVSPTLLDLLNVFFIDESNGWAVGISGIAIQTTDGGNNWNIILDGWTTNMLRSVQFTSSTNGYVLGNNKTLFKYGLLTEVEQQPTQPTEFKLEQNYPNPFNPSATIRYTIPLDVRGETRKVSLKIYDVLGNEVATLVDEEKSAGSYEVEFNTSSINHHPSSGIYFYQLKAGNYLETKKMILLK